MCIVLVNLLLEWYLVWLVLACDVNFVLNVWSKMSLCFDCDDDMVFDLKFTFKHSVLGCRVSSVEHRTIRDSINTKLKLKIMAILRITSCGTHEQKSFLLLLFISHADKEQKPQKTTKTKIPKSPEKKKLRWNIITKKSESWKLCEKVSCFEIDSNKLLKTFHFRFFVYNILCWCVVGEWWVGKVYTKSALFCLSVDNISKLK